MQLNGKDLKKRKNACLRNNLSESETDVQHLGRTTEKVKWLFVPRCTDSEDPDPSLLSM